MNKRKAQGTSAVAEAMAGQVAHGARVKTQKKEKMLDIRYWI